MKKEKENLSTSSSQYPKGERVLVFVRIRPFSEQELKTDSTSPIENIDYNRNAMTGKKNKKYFIINNKN